MKSSISGREARNLFFPHHIRNSQCCRNLIQYDEYPTVITCDDSVSFQDESNMFSVINDQGKNPDGNRNNENYFISSKSEMLKSNNKQLPVRTRRLPVTRSEDFLW
jgi:hypothetical protein